MEIKMHGFTLKAGLIISIGTSLVACGGGGGGNDSATSPVGAGGTGATTAPYSAISQANYPTVAAQGYSVMTILTEAPNSLGGFATGVEISLPSLNLAEMSNKIYQRFRAKTSQLVTGVVQTQPCSGGGTVTINASQANNDRLSVGDTGSFTASNCTESDLGTLNGGISFKVTSVSGDPVNSERFSIGLAAQYSNFSLRDRNENVAIDGDMALLLSQNSSNDVAVSISGNSLSFTVTSSGKTGTAQLSAYSMKGTEVNGVSTTSASYIVSASSSPVGSYTYKVDTKIPIVQSNSSQYPSSGSLLIQGSPATVTVTALNSSSVRIDYSTAGNGAVTDSRTMSWQEFDALN
jgi:hypothetical protein